MVERLLSFPTNFLCLKCKEQNMIRPNPLSAELPFQSFLPCPAVKQETAFLILSSVLSEQMKLRGLAQCLHNLAPARASVMLHPNVAAFGGNLLIFCMLMNFFLFIFPPFLIVSILLNLPIKVWFHK